MSARRALIAAILPGILFLAPTGSSVAKRSQADPQAAVKEDPLRILILPFAPRGAPQNAWAEIMSPLYAALRRPGVEIVRHVAVERELRERRLRDMSILSHEDLVQVATTVTADKVLLGYIFRLDDGPDPAVSLSGRLIDLDRLAIERLAVTVVEGQTFIGPLGSAGKMTFERTLDEAINRFASALAGESLESFAQDDRERLLKASALAPSPIDYLSPAIAETGIRSLVVLPFRNKTERTGAGQIVADLFQWCLTSSEQVSVYDAGDATHRLLEKGWRTGMPVGRDEILSLGEDPGVDAVLMGSVVQWEDGLPSGGRPPSVSFSARLLDARTGTILWAAEHERKGDETLIVYDIGTERLVEALAARSSFEALEPLMVALAGGKSSRSGGRK
jgi:TolB-like protein